MARPVARPDFGINHVVAYGQSLSSGWEGTPVLSRSPRLDCLMLGESLRPRSEHAPQWQPVGEAELQPLVATAQRTDGTMLSHDQVDALPADSVLLGETVLEGALHQWRGAMGCDAGRLLAASACGVGGRSLEQLSRGADPELFNRLRDCVRLTRAAALGLGRSYGIAAFLLLHGENNNWGLDGATDDRAAYKALMAALCRDLRAELAVAVAGQSDPPAIFTYQTGAAYAADHMAIPMAQWEASRELDGVFLAAPVYPVTDKGGHLDAHGYRWLGAQFGKVMHRVLDLGEAWLPLAPLAVQRSGPVLHVRFHVPAPPLAFGRPHAGRTAVDVADQGFAVLDDAGPVPVASVELAGDTAVAIRLARLPRGACRLRYAGRTGHGGLGGLHDSDRTHAVDGMAGRPYDLANWCIAFVLPVD